MTWKFIGVFDVVEKKKETVKWNRGKTASNWQNNTRSCLFNAILLMKQSLFVPLTAWNEASRILATRIQKKNESHICSRHSQTMRKNTQTYTHTHICLKVNGRSVKFYSIASLHSGAMVCLLLGNYRRIIL